MTKINTREQFRLNPVVLVIDYNPKKKGTMSWDRFENYLNMDWSIEQTVKDCLDNGVRMDDIRHDSEHGFIIVGEKEIELHKERMELKKEEDIRKAKELLGIED